jgi:hypothetical protein
MSITQTHVAVVLADANRQTNDDDTIADALFRSEPVAVEELIAHVLRRAHRMAETADAPEEARAIFHVAHSFADELAGADPQFDRHRFIQAATNGAS